MTPSGSRRPPLMEKLPVLRSVAEEVVSRWLSDERMASLLHKYGMEEGYFRSHYALPLYEAFLEIARGDRGWDTAPILRETIDYVKNRDMILGDLHRLCSLYRRSLLAVVNERGWEANGLYEEIEELFDEQFREALGYYNESVLSHDRSLQKELMRFREYQKVIDRSAIVSKTDPEGIITYVNQAFCKISRYAYDEVIGRSHRLIRDPETPESFHAALWEQIRAKKVFHATIKNRAKNGESYYVDTTIIPILDEENAIVEYISMSYDITPLIEAVEALEKAQRVKDEFLANMGHEIRTPLNAILGFIAILRKQIGEGKGAHYVEVIQSSAQMLLKILNDVLDLSKMQSGKFTVTEDPFDPMRELCEAVDLFGPQASEKAIRLAVFIDPSLPPCLAGDGFRIKQIVSNLLSNAIKFTPPKGTVKVKGVYEQGELRFSVQDNGIGIPPEKQQTIFEAFEQADNSITRQYGGTGLGLSICTQLIAQMGGQLLFRSVEGKGSLFGFHIPVRTCRERETKGSERPRYEVLRIALVEHPERPETTLLIEKYLRGFGIVPLPYPPPEQSGRIDAVFCSEDSVFAGELSRSPIPVVWLHRCCNILSVEEGGMHLFEPLLPDAISDLLESLRGDR